MKYVTTTLPVFFLLLATSCASTWEERFASDLSSIWAPILETLEHVVDTPTAVEAQRTLAKHLNQLDAFERKSQTTKRPVSNGPSEEVNRDLSAMWDRMRYQIKRINSRPDTGPILRSTLARVQQKRNWSYVGS